MRIISHRGYWKQEIEKNSEIAFHRSFRLNIGTETDFRDYNGELVISHDIPTEGTFISADEFGMILNQYTSGLPLAINIKSDGIHKVVKEFIYSLGINDYFVFDMSIPDTINYLNLGINVFIRQSEYEKDLPFYELVKGIWLDAFENIWYSEVTVKKHISNGKRVAIVSNELHNREHLKHWNFLKSWSIINDDNLILCTDRPEEATKFFKYE